VQTSNKSGNRKIMRHKERRGEGQNQVSKDVKKGAGGNAVVKAQCYKPEDRGLETRCGNLFSIYLIIPVALVPGVYSASNRNEYQEQKNNISAE
jgi:hypothetical protein